MHNTAQIIPFPTRRAIAPQPAPMPATFRWHWGALFAVCASGVVAAVGFVTCIAFIGRTIVSLLT